MKWRRIAVLLVPREESRLYKVKVLLQRYTQELQADYE